MSVLTIFINRKILSVLFVMISAVAGCQPNKDAYEGLKNKKMIETLKNFPNKTARWNVPAEDGRLLYDIVKENNYQRALEVGTSNGYSALWTGFALQENNGRMITLEINEERAGEARQNIKDAGLEAVIEVRNNNALEEIPRIEGNFDFVFLDASKSDYLEYYRMLEPRLKPGGAIAAHNVTNMKYAMEDFLTAIRKNDDFTVKVYEVSGQGVLVATKAGGK